MIGGHQAVEKEHKTDRFDLIRITLYTISYDAEATPEYQKKNQQGDEYGPDDLLWFVSMTRLIALSQVALYVFDHGGDGDAPHQAAADDMVLGGTSHGDAFQC